MAAEPLRRAGHDVIWAGDWPADPGDEEILRRAAADDRMLATIDKDFGELIIVQGKVHVGLIRLVGFRARDQGPALVRLFSRYESELAAGAMLTAEPWRVRVRPGMRPAQDPRPHRARVTSLEVSYTGAIPPGDIGEGWVRSATWPLDFELAVHARFDHPVVSTAASIEILRKKTGERIARIVKPIVVSEGASIQSWRGTIELASIKSPGEYEIVIHIDGVAPVRRSLIAHQI